MLVVVSLVVLATRPFARLGRTQFPISAVLKEYAMRLELRKLRSGTKMREARVGLGSILTWYRSLILSQPQEILFPTRQPIVYPE